MKAYKICFPGFKKIDINRDVTFDEDSAYNKYIKRPVEDFEETKVPKIQDTTMNDAYQNEYHEIEEPQEPVDPPKEKNPHKRKPYMGTRCYPRCRKKWGSRRNAQREEKN